MALSSSYRRNYKQLNLLSCITNTLALQKLSIKLIGDVNDYVQLSKKRIFRSERNIPRENYISKDPASLESKLIPCCCLPCNYLTI